MTIKEATEKAGADMYSPIWMLIFALQLDRFGIGSSIKNLLSRNEK